MSGTLKPIGIIGGIAPESTIAYYRRIIARCRELVPDAYPPILINSIDLTKMLRMVAASQFDALVEFLSQEVAKLARAGAGFALLASNTPHIVFDELRRAAPIPMISIVEETARAAQVRGFERVGLLATRFTMRGGFYNDVFARFGLTVVLPDDEEQEFVHAKYIGNFVDGRYDGELVNGIFLPETRHGYVKIIRAMAERTGIEAVILGGTELPLLLRDEAEAGIPLLDTTVIHVESAIAAMLH